MNYTLEHSDVVLEFVHPATLCKGRACPVHRKTKHHMRKFPQHWRDDRKIMERLCPHGVGHPDPDHLAAVKARKGVSEARVESIHGCDGCCRPKRKRVK